MRKLINIPLISEFDIYEGSYEDWELEFGKYTVVIDYTSTLDIYTVVSGTYDEPEEKGVNTTLDITKIEIFIGDVQFTMTEKQKEELINRLTKNYRVL